MKEKSEKTDAHAAEKQLNIGLDPDVKRDLGRVALHSGRTQRKQAAMYVAKCVERDIRRLERTGSAKRD